MPDRRIRELLAFAYNWSSKGRQFEGSEGAVRPVGLNVIPLIAVKANFRFWLNPEVAASLINVRSYPSSGHPEFDVRFSPIYVRFAPRSGHPRCRL